MEPFGVRDVARRGQDGLATGWVASSAARRVMTRSMRSSGRSPDGGRGAARVVVDETPVAAAGVAVSGYTMARGRAPVVRIH